MSLLQLQPTPADADRDGEDVDPSSTTIGLLALPGILDRKLLKDAKRARTALTPSVRALPDSVTVDAPGTGTKPPSPPSPSFPAPLSPPPPPPGRLVSQSC